MAKPVKTPAGTWRIKVERAGYKTQTKTCKTQKAAEAWGRDIESAMDKGQQPMDTKAARSKTVRELFERYIEECTVPMEDGKPKIKRARSTINALKRLMDTAEFMPRRLNQIEAKDISDWRDLRLSKVKASSVDREFSPISAVFKHAIMVWKEPLALNPARLTSRPQYNKKGRKMGWREDQIQAVCKTLCYEEGVYPQIGEFLPGQSFNREKGLRESKSAFVAYAFLVALETSMRQGEIAQLTVADFDAEGGYVRLYITKNGDPRLVALNERAFELVSLLCEGFPPEHKIFQYSGGTISCYFTKARQTAGINGLTFHDSRHEAITRMVPMFTNILELAAQTGHRKLQSLQAYYNPDIKIIRSRLLGQSPYVEPPRKQAHLRVVRT